MKLVKRQELSCLLTLKPPDLRGGAVSLLVSRSDPEDDGGLGRRVDVRAGEVRVGHDALRLRPAEHAHEGELARRAAHRLGVALRCGPDGQIHLKVKQHINGMAVTSSVNGYLEKYVFPPIRSVFFRQNRRP